MEKLYMGVAREIITPKIGGQLYGYSPDVFSNALADDLTATAFYFKQGEAQALMISVTVCLLNTAMTAEVIAQISEKFGIPKQKCIISATHTHSGPNTNGHAGWGGIDKKYCDGILIPGILKAIEQAVNNTQAVTVGTASGNSYVGVNRRELTKENRIVLGQNPWGAFNPRMTVVSFKNEEGTVVANMIHYGCHGTAAGRNLEITRDWSGFMTDQLEDQSGAITAFFNGPEGDIGPRLSNGDTTGGLYTGFRYAEELGHVAAQDAVRIYKEIYDYKEVELVCDGKEILVPLKARMPLEEAKALYEQYKERVVNFEGALRQYALDTIAAYENNAPELVGAPIQQTVVAFGNLVFASFPYELFSEIGMRIDGCFADKRVLSLSNANGSEGYFITEDVKCRGGYEVIMFMYGQPQPYCNHADFELMKLTVEHIKEVLREK
ncbi:MAG: neutral/alkaline non-lysosomal ceramidase N-terminal domain-containing protein [Clostridia bacterium]|nr:neutral/alkaline non-lysosomal ceramidase N-terminal domain-containing protein [Clostridia bacterium]